MKKEQLLDQLDTAWNDFEISFTGLTNEQLLIPNVTGQWSVRDIIAHVTWWEEETLKHLPVIREGGRTVRYSIAYGGIDAFNALMTAKRRHLSLEQVLRQHRDVHAQLTEYVRDAPEELIKRESRFRRRLRFDTYGHYPVHSNAVRAWRARMDI
jgi:hypothetical protein